MKEFKDLFPDLETCKKFQEMGLFGESCFVWVVEDTSKPHERWSVPQNSIIAPAPTTDEILAELPAQLNYEEEDFDLFPNKVSSGFYASYISEDCNYHPSTPCFQKEPMQLPKALAELYLKLKAEGIT